MKKYFQKFFVFSLIMLSGYGGYLTYLSYSGYCFRENRYLSDEERIRLVVNEILANYSRDFEFEKGLKKNQLRGQPLSGRPIPYRDMNEFRALNPGCCEVVTQYTSPGGEGGEVTFWDRLTGATHSIVHIKYLQRYRDSKGIAQSRLIETHYASGNCGYVWNGI